jgi:GT2 family glycosyltransferase
LRGYDTTRRCLESLRSVRGWPFPTLVVDNASGTGEGERLAAEFGAPVVSITRLVDDGVPGGYNAALSWSASIGASHILLMNNDTIVKDPEILERLLAAAAEPRVAAVAPLTVDGEGSIFSAGGTLDWVRGRSGHRKTALFESDPYDADWLDGPALLVSVDAARVVGGLAPEYFMYWEDVDWCIRARRAGFRCLIEPSTSITHLGGGSPSRQAIRQGRRNAILFMRRNGGWMDNVTSLAYFLTVGALRTFVGSCFAGHGIGVGIAATASGVAWNVRDALSVRRWRVPPDGPGID